MNPLLHCALAVALVVLSVDCVIAQSESAADPELLLLSTSDEFASERLFDRIKQIWETDTWVNQTRTVYPLDGGSIEQEWNGTGWKSVSGRRSTDEYDSLENGWSIREEWVETGWQPVARTIWMTDGSGQPLERIVQKWDGIDWINGYRLSWRWGEDGLDGSTRHQWDGSGWYESERYFNTYDERGNVTEIYSILWNGISWENQSRTISEFDSLDNQIVGISQKGNGQEWVNRRRDHMTYDLAGNLTEQVVMPWVEGQWKNHERNVHVFDNSGLRIGWVVYFYFAQSVDWEPASHSTYHYDANGNRVGTTVQRWGDTGWINYQRTTSAYDSDGNRIETFDENWTEDEWRHVLYSGRRRFHYDDASNLIESVGETSNGTEFVNVWRDLRTYGNLLGTAITETGPTDEQPGVVVLHQNYPNPLNRSTTIPYELNSPARVKLTVLDVLGRVVEVLVDRQLPAGRHTARWNAAGFGNGIYFYRLESGRSVETRGLLLAR